MPSIFYKFEFYINKVNTFWTILVQFYILLGKVVDDFAFASLEVSRGRNCPLLRMGGIEGKKNGDLRMN
jgi:hypothetical protein